MINAKVIGATGYGGLGILEGLLRHPAARVTSLVARQDDTRRIDEFFPHLRGHCDLRVQVAGQEVDDGTPDVVFFATPNGVGMAEARAYLEAGVKVIDYSGDFRFKDPAVYEQWYGAAHTAPDLLAEAVYGLPEFYRAQIAGARLVANPGCFVVAAVLALAPAVKAGLIEPSGIIVDGKSGISGAGKSPKPTFHFPHRNENVEAYRIVEHQHTPEIETYVGDFGGQPVTATFVAHIVPTSRGILDTCYGRLRQDVSAAEAREVYLAAYADEPFVRVSRDGTCHGTGVVLGSNFVDLAVNVNPRTRQLVVTAAVDNLVKGQAGSALQNMNVLFGLPEDQGLERFGLYP
ncbi:MAG: N-acetyl-gamma-glutamyl-phosphate reductase [Fimbriimonadaceae bacterium]|nr:N-acetyl-gamma-glutamyl-phosphate reductase [Fimbriimonadaceae bacterium]